MCGDGRHIDQGVRLRGDGRHAAGSPRRRAGRCGIDDAPHLILFPERRFDEADFLARVDATVKRVGTAWWSPAKASRPRRQFVADAGAARTPSGTPSSAACLASRRPVKDTLATRCTGRCRLPAALARHLASKTDLEQAEAVGRRRSSSPSRNERGDAGDRAHVRCAYRWKIEAAPLTKVATTRRRCPRVHPPRRIRHHAGGPQVPGAADPRRITTAVRTRCLPKYVALKNVAVKQKLPPFAI